MDHRVRRAMVFIDGSNLYYYSMRSRFEGRELDFGRFIRKLAGEADLIRAYFFDARISAEHEPERHEAQEKFFDYLRQVPQLEVRLVDLNYNGSDSPQQKSVDVGLAVLMVEHAIDANFDIAILVTGDADFLPACQSVKDRGRILNVVIPGEEGTSVALRKVADEVIQLDEACLRDCWRVH